MSMQQINEKGIYQPQVFMPMADVISLHHRYKTKNATILYLLAFICYLTEYCYYDIPREHNTVHSPLNYL